MSCRLNDVLKLPSVEVRWGQLLPHQRSYLDIAFDEAINDPLLCNGYDEEVTQVGRAIVKVIEIRVAHAYFLLALSARKPPILLDIQTGDLALVIAEAWA